MTFFNLRTIVLESTHWHCKEKLNLDQIVYLPSLRYWSFTHQCVDETQPATQNNDNLHSNTSYGKKSYRSHPQSATLKFKNSSTFTVLHFGKFEFFRFSTNRKNLQKQYPFLPRENRMTRGKLTGVLPISMLVRVFFSLEYPWEEGGTTRSPHKSRKRRVFSYFLQIRS